MKSVFLIITGLFMLVGQVFAGEPPAAQEDTDAREKTENLVQMAFEAAIQGIGHTGGLYPFALLQEGTEKVSTVSWDGEPEDRLPADEWSEELMQVLRKKAQEEEFNAAALARLHSGESEEGKPFLGVWVLADHENDAPWIAFLPLLETDRGTYEQADELVYAATDQWIFPPSDEEEDETEQQPD